MKRRKPESLVPVVLQPIDDLTSQQVFDAKLEGHEQHLADNFNRYVLETEQVARHAGRHGDYITKLDALKTLLALAATVIRMLERREGRNGRARDDDEPLSNDPAPDLSGKTDAELMASLPKKDR